MRIGIDYTAAVRQGAGIGRYARQLVQALTKIDTHNEYVLLAAVGIQAWKARIPGAKPHAECLSPFAQRSLLDVMNSPRVTVVHLPLPERLLTILWHRLHLPFKVELFTGGLDVFHSPDFALPPIHKARTIVTVHDLSFMCVPECSAPKLRSYLLQVVPASVSRADVVLADSECTKKDVIELLGVNATRVEVVYAGVEPRFQRVHDKKLLKAVRIRYHLPARFMLSLGTLQPRKNFTRLIEAYARVRQKVSNDIKLVIAGGPGWMYKDIFQKVEELALQGTVCFPGYVADEDLPALYTMADLFVFPSLYEGFGLPPLEAMACGTPVVTSNVSSLPEVVGDAALLVDPLDVGALAEAMGQVLADPALRSQMIRRGLVQASQFTWSRSAEKLLDIYARLMQ